MGEVGEVEKVEEGEEGEQRVHLSGGRAGRES